MSRIALYREWRPRTFDQVVEQRHTVAALRQSVISGNISHAYLFSGTRGTGKTTLAQVFSRAINCRDPQDGNPCNVCEICRGILDGSLLDVVEVDAASNNSVDNIRRICDEVHFMPTLARYKVYIVDEVHMLSPGAFNALLKTLEEPPAHAVFILATTDPHRIPPTIVSRCQRYDFHRIPVAGIVGRLREIADADGIRVTDDALEAVATLADGAMRDAISLLDQCRATFPDGTGRDDVLSLAGVVNDAFMYDMAAAMAGRDAARAMVLTDAMILDGRDVMRFTSDLAGYFRDVMMCKVSSAPETLVRASTDAIRGMRAVSALYPLDTLLEIIRALSALLTELRWAPDPRTMFEIALIRIMQTSLATGNAAPAARLESAPPVKSEPTAAPVPVVRTAPKPAVAAVPAATPVPAAPEPAVAEPEPDDPADFDDNVFPEDIPEEQPEELPEEPSEALPVDQPVDPVMDDKPYENQQDLFAFVPASAEPRRQGPAPETLRAAWEEMLTGLCNSGQMVLYLFLRPARVSFDDGRITVLFHPDEAHNRAEVTKKSNETIIKDALAKTAGCPVELVVRTEAEAGPAAEPAASWQDAEWVRRIRRSADDMGIPVTFTD